MPHGPNLNLNLAMLPGSTLSTGLHADVISNPFFP
jgi:hypothetical protein